MAGKKPSRRPRKPIRITTHALERMRQRRVSHNQLTVAIRKPNARGPGNTLKTEKISKAFHGGRRLVAIIEENSKEIKVVTAYWQ